MKPRAEIGVFGGSGFYSFFKKAREVTVSTPYGTPSGKVTLSTVEGRQMAFLPRHGVNHQYPPHTVPYKANVHAFKQLGVSRIIAPNAVGSLKPEVEPGDLVFCDQFVNFTTGREDTFYDGPETTHVSTAEPYCPQMRKVAVHGAKKLGLRFRESGTEPRRIALDRQRVTVSRLIPSLCLVCLLISKFSVRLRVGPALAGPFPPRRAWHLRGTFGVRNAPLRVAAGNRSGRFSLWRRAFRSGGGAVESGGRRFKSDRWLLPPHSCREESSGENRHEEASREGDSS